MSKIIADADGLIKLGKSGCVPALLAAQELLVPSRVWAEAVETGKRMMYEDAFELERALKEGDAEVVEARPNLRAEELVEGSSAYLGAGERAALSLFFERRADAILTDDRAFLGLLSSAGVPALVPTAAVSALAASGAISPARAKEALGRIRGLVRTGAYEAAMEELREVEEARE